VQGLERLEQYAGIEHALVNRGRGVADAKQRIDGGLRRADRVFDRKNRIVRHLAVLADEREVLRASGNDVRPVTTLSGQELAGYEWYETRDTIRAADDTLLAGGRTMAARI